MNADPSLVCGLPPIIDACISSPYSNTVRSILPCCYNVKLALAPGARVALHLDVYHSHAPRVFVPPSLLFDVGERPSFKIKISTFGANNFGTSKCMGSVSECAHPFDVCGDTCTEIFLVHIHIHICEQYTHTYNKSWKCIRQHR